MKFTDIEQVVQATIKAYDGIEKLSMIMNEQESKCLYAATINGIGCAIGCHIKNQEVAKTLDVFNHCNPTVTMIFNAPSYEFSEKKKLAFNYLFGEIFDMTKISINELQWLQNCHDGSKTVDEFIMKLKERKFSLVDKLMETV